MKIFFSIILVSIYSFNLFCQDNQQNTSTKTAQPTIMAIPFARQGVSLRQVYEHDEVVRIAVTKVKEGFDKRGVNTIDLRAKLKQTNNNAALQEDQVTETKDEVIAASGADIYVEVEASKNFSQSGNSVNIILTAYDAFSGESLANKTGNSPKVYSDNFEKLTEKAIESELDNLLNTIQEKFNDMRVNGRTITFTIGVGLDADLKMSTEMDSSGDVLSDIIEDWVAENAFKAQYHIQGVTANKITFDLVKVPLYDENGSNYRINTFVRSFRKFLSNNSITSESVVQGNNIVFTIKGSK